MESILNLTLFGATLYFSIAIIVLFLIFIIADLYEEGIGALAGFFMFLVLQYMWGDIAFFDIFSFRNITAYLIIGFIFSIVRTYFKGKKLDQFERRHYDLRSAVFRWMFLWPFALINWVVGNLLKDLFNYFYSFVESLFLKIFNS